MSDEYWYTQYCRPTWVLGIYNDGHNLCCKVACGDYFKGYLKSVVITVTMLYILTVLRVYVFDWELTYFFMISCTKYTKNVLLGSPAVLVRDEIHCNKYPGTCPVMNVGYPGSKISTHFNPMDLHLLSGVVQIWNFCMVATFCFLALTILMHISPIDENGIGECLLKYMCMCWFRIFAKCLL